MRSSERSHQKHARRYPIFADRFVDLALVYDGDGEWFVENAEARGEQSRLSIRQFEESETGRRLKLQLAIAIDHAQQDL